MRCLNLATLATSTHSATDAKRETFGTMPDEARIDTIMLTDVHGATARSRIGTSIIQWNTDHFLNPFLECSRYWPVGITRLAC